MNAQRMGEGQASERGSSVIEAALVTLLLLLLLAGAVDIGRAFYGFIVVTNAAREGARLATRLPCTSANLLLLHNAILAAVDAEADGLGEDTTVITTITPDPLGTGCAAAGTPIKVSVSYQLPTIMASVLGFSEITISNSASMVAFGNDQG